MHPSMRPPFGDMKTFCLVLLGFPVLAAAVPVRGTLVGPAGKPLASATLMGYAWRKTPNPNDGFIRFAIVTDGKGAFRLDLPTLPSPERPLTLIARLADGRYGTVRLTADQGEAKIDLRTEALRVRTVDPQGAPIAGARVSLTSVLITSHAKTGFNSIGEIQKPQLSQLTDAQGYATFKGIPSGAMVQFEAKQSGMLPGQGRIMRLINNVEQSVTLAKASILSGRVLREGNSVPDVTVLATSVRDRVRRTERAKTDQNGEYRLQTAPGRNSLSLDLGSLARDWTAKGYEDLRLKPGGELNGLNFVLERGIMLQGTVLTKRGDKPVPDAKVRMNGPAGMNVWTTSDAQGRFSGRIVPGSWYVAIDEVADQRLGNQVYLRAEIDAEHNPALELRVPDAALLRPIPNLGGWWSMRRVLPSPGRPFAVSAEIRRPPTRRDGSASRRRPPPERS